MKSKTLIIIGSIMFCLGIILNCVALSVSPFSPPSFTSKIATSFGLKMLLLFGGAGIALYGRHRHTKEKYEEKIEKQKRGEGVLVITAETIPGKKIVKILGPIHARNNPFTFSLDGAANAQEYLEKEAEKLGANAIIGFKIERQQYRKSTTYFASGSAVIMEDEK